MYMRLDMFAALLGIRPGVLLHAARTDGLLGGMTLPARRQVRGAAVMFNHEEAISFAKRWQTQETESLPASSGQPLITLGLAAEKAGIAPLELWQAVQTGKKLQGVTPPPAEKSSNGQLLFEPAAVTQFALRYRSMLKIRK
ncbi:hypothetical protein [Pantoea agglomerans]|uniref:hypothetical protein n=1 Tax=Enterobacter agglomerans TaxID=549 RepID=UPI0032094BDD